MAPKAKTMMDQRELLRILHKTTPTLRRKLLATFPKEMIQLLSECALNILKGTVVLKMGQKEKLRPYSSKLHKLANKRLSRTKKAEVVQKGGFLAALLGPVLEATLGPLVKSVAPIFGAVLRGDS